MPDGFEPHTELARIYTLRQLITECRAESHKSLETLIEIRDNPNEVASDRIKAAGMIWDRAFGKPKQQVDVSINTEKEKKISIELPPNDREAIPESPIIDAIAV